MQRSLALRIGTLVFAGGALALVIVHGCSRSGPTAQNAAPAASPQDDPAYLGATKAAVVVQPQATSSAKKK